MFTCFHKKIFSCQIKDNDEYMFWLLFSKFEFRIVPVVIILARMIIDFVLLENKFNI